MTEIHICTELSVDEADPSIESPQGDVQPVDPGVVEPVVRIALLRDKLWSPGSTIKIRFLDGDAALQAKVKERATEWLQFANLNFDFTTDTSAPVRITFNRGGSWSYMGTDATRIPAERATMQFGWLTNASSATEISRVVLHEFGHMLGAFHEHQNPSTDIPWDKPKVYQYYKDTQNPPWDKARTDTNIFRKYAAGSSNYTEFDHNSIMLYAIPNALTIGDYEVGSNTILSSLDKLFMAVNYPVRSLSFQSINFPDRYIRHRGYVCWVEGMDSDLARKDGSFGVRPGFSGDDTVSFESLNFPGYYLRHSGYRLRISDRSLSPSVFNQDASFKPVPGLAGTGVSFESVNFPGRFLRHRNYEMWLDEREDSDLFKHDASFNAMAGQLPWNR